MSVAYGMELISLVAFGCLIGFLGWMCIDSEFMLRQSLSTWIVGQGITARTVRVLCQIMCLIIGLVVMGVLLSGAYTIGQPHVSQTIKDNYWWLFFPSIWLGSVLRSIFLRWCFKKYEALTAVH